MNLHSVIGVTYVLTKWCRFIHTPTPSAAPASTTIKLAPERETHTRTYDGRMVTVDRPKEQNLAHPLDGDHRSRELLHKLHVLCRERQNAMRHL